MNILPINKPVVDTILKIHARTNIKVRRCYSAPHSTERDVEKREVSPRANVPHSAISTVGLIPLYVSDVHWRTRKYEVYGKWSTAIYAAGSKTGTKTK
jgi:hypothetical protein